MNDQDGLFSVGTQSSGGGNLNNEQIGVINANAQANLNVTIFLVELPGLVIFFKRLRGGWLD